MESSVTPLPPGVEASYPPGPEEVIIRRLADPVQLKPAGQHSAYPLRYFDKRRRANAGAWVFCSAGGRAEILWPDSGTTIVLFDFCTGIVGSPSRGEPNFLFREIQRAVLMLNDGDQIELLGGALLTADSGPWLLERRSFDILRVKNQTKVAGEVAYRNEVFQLGPGQAVDLPLLVSGGAPIAAVPGAETIRGPGFDLHYFGDVQAVEVDDIVEVRGSGEHEVGALGIRLHLAPGDVARFGGLTAPQRPGHFDSPAPAAATPMEANPEGATPTPDSHKESSTATPAEESPSETPSDN
ncbi:MAG: hypothetical protein ACI9F9_002985 [Candidatus Paceibacteria bacterium]|jgi:hypothetical protein